MTSRTCGCCRVSGGPTQALGGEGFWVYTLLGPQGSICPASPNPHCSGSPGSVCPALLNLPASICLSCLSQPPCGVPLHLSVSPALLASLHLGAVLKGDPSTGLLHSYLVMPFMGTDLGKLMKHEKLSDDRIQFLVYQMLKGLKVGVAGLRGGQGLDPAS